MCESIGAVVIGDVADADVVNHSDVVSTLRRRKIAPVKFGAATFRITTLRITALNIYGLFVILRINDTKNINKTVYKGPLC